MYISYYINFIKYLRNIGGISIGVTIFIGYHSLLKVLALIYIVLRFNLEPTPSFYVIHFINWLAKCLFSYSKYCSHLSGSLALEALLIGVHCEQLYISV